MNRRETIIQTLQHKETPQIPFHMDFTQQALDKLIAYTGDPEIEQKIGAYLYYIQYWGWPTELPDKPGYFKDDFGVVWNRNGADKDIGLPDENIIEDLETETYTFPTLDEARFRAECQAMTAHKDTDDRFTMYAFGFSMFERSWSIMGMENILCNMITCPRETLRFFEEICEYYGHLVDIALEYDFDAIYFGDDWGQQRGLIMGYDHWRHYIRPQMEKLYRKVKDKGLYVFQHSCGDCHELFPDFIDMGMDCYQTFQPEVYDVAEMKRLYGKDLTFWGGISTQQCLPYATPEQVKEEAVRLYDLLHKDGGYIIAPTHALAFDVPPENILAMAEVFHNQDKYFGK